MCVQSVCVCVCLYVYMCERGKERERERERKYESMRECHRVMCVSVLVLVSASEQLIACDYFCVVV